MLRNAKSIMGGESPASSLGAYAVDETVLASSSSTHSPDCPCCWPTPKHSLCPVMPLSKHGEDWHLPGKLVSNGPFRLLERKPQERVSLVKNEHYYASDDVQLDRVDYFPSDAVETSVNRFRAGEFHINGWPGFPPRQQGFLKEELGAAVR